MVLAVSRLSGGFKELFSRRSGDSRLLMLATGRAIPQFAAFKLEQKKATNRDRLEDLGFALVVEGRASRLT